MLGRFFPPGEGSAWVLLSTGENLYWYTFSGGDSIPGRFFRGEVLCGGKLYATTPAPVKSRIIKYCSDKEKNGIRSVMDIGIQRNYGKIRHPSIRGFWSKVIFCYGKICNHPPPFQQILYQSIIVK